MALAVWCLSAGIVADGRLLSLGGLFSLLFLFYSFLVPAFERRSSGKLALVRLVFDALFFFGFATSASSGLWLSAFFGGFVLLEAALWHEWREVAMFVGLSLVLLVSSRPPFLAGLAATVLVAGLVCGVLAFQRERIAARLEDANRRATRSAADAEAARESERQRIAADFHDGPLQSFIGLQMRLEILRKMMERDPKLVAEELSEIQDLTRSQVGDLRAFVRGMRAIEPEGTSLAGAIRRVVEDFRKHSGISATLLGADSLGGAEAQAFTEVVQMVREALHNAQKHSGASRVTVEAVRSGNILEILVEDDGTGFPFGGSFTLDELDSLRIGPESIRRRVRGLGGEMVLESKPGQGSGLRVRIPV